MARFAISSALHIRAQSNTKRYLIRRIARSWVARTEPQCCQHAARPVRGTTNVEQVRARLYNVPMDEFGLTSKANAIHDAVRFKVSCNAVAKANDAWRLGIIPRQFRSPCVPNLCASFAS